MRERRPWRGVFEAAKIRAPLGQLHSQQLLKHVLLVSRQAGLDLLKDAPIDERPDALHQVIQRTERR